MTEPVVGTRFPFINLQKALGQAEKIYKADQKGREMAVAGAFEVWGYSAKSSGGFQTVAALKMYGLLKDANGGDTRKVALTDEALRYFRDEREEEKQKLLRAFALKPKLIAALWADWGAHPPADTVARSHLKTDRSLNDQGARSLLAIYKENLALAGLKGDGKIPAVNPVKFDADKPKAKVGDYVQWTSDGADQFSPPRRVTWVADDGSHLRAHGSLTGIPMNEVTVVPEPATDIKPPVVESSATVQGENEVNILQRGGRLEISATVDLEGLENFKQMLSHYENILKLTAKAAKPKPAN